MSRRRAVALAGLALLLAGCAEGGGIASTPTTVSASPAATVTPDPATGAARSASEVTRVVLRTGSSNVRVEASDEPGYQVRRRVNNAPSAPDSFREEDGALVLDGCTVTDDCWFDYAVTVPRTVTLEGASGSGPVAATGLAGVDLTTGSGPVVLTGIDGDVTVRTGSGPVQGSGLDGTRIEVTTGSGPVALTLVAGQYRVAARTGGPRTVDLPDTPTATRTVTVTSQNGPISLGVGG